MHNHRNNPGKTYTLGQVCLCLVMLPLIYLGTSVCHVLEVFSRDAANKFGLSIFGWMERVATKAGL